MGKWSPLATRMGEQRIRPHRCNQCVWCVWHHIAPALVLRSCRCIEVFQAPSLKLLCSIQQHHKVINVLRWHHELDSAPRLHGLLASGSSNAIVYVHDLRPVLGEFSGPLLTPSYLLILPLDAGSVQRTPPRARRC